MACDAMFVQSDKMIAMEQVVFYLLTLIAYEIVYGENLAEIQKYSFHFIFIQIDLPNNYSFAVIVFTISNRPYIWKVPIIWALNVTI